MRKFTSAAFPPIEQEDFGLTKFTDIEHGLTLSRPAAGSPAYMAPEHARDGETSAPTDLYGLGASLYAALTSRAPHAGRAAQLAELGSVW